MASMILHMAENVFQAAKAFFLQHEFTVVGSSLYNLLQ